MKRCSTKTLRSLHKHPSLNPPTTNRYYSQPDPLQLEESLKACSSPLLSLHGNQLHAHLLVNGFPSHGTLAARILGMYVLTGQFNYAKAIFFRDPFRWSVRTMPWNWMIRGCNELGWFRFAVLFWFKMVGCGVSPDKYTFPPVVKACCGLNSVRLGRMVHRRILEMGFGLDIFVGSALVKLYAENGCLVDAGNLFAKMPERDCVLWNVMLRGLAKYGGVDECLEMFRVMVEDGSMPNEATFACVLSVCGLKGMSGFAMQLHGFAVKCGLEFEPSVANSLVAAYAKCRLLPDARRLFRSMPQTCTITWNGMITGLVQNGFSDESLSLFRDMICSGVKPDATTFSSLIPSLSESTDLKQAKEIHGYMVRHGVVLDTFLVSALIDVYAKCGDMEMSCKIFKSSPVIDFVACTAMISGYVLNGMNRDALETFIWLIRRELTPNSLTLSSILPAIAGLCALKLGKELHGYILKNGLDANCHVGSAILDMYAKCGRLDLAHVAFRKLPSRDSFCWNMMITGCSRNGKPDQAIDLFREMGREGLSYDCVSVSAALSVCASLPSIGYGKEIHNFIIKNAFAADVFAESTLIDMYAKCGMLRMARLVFNMMQVKNEVAWNSMIAAYGYHGHLEESLSLFHRMLESGLHPDRVSFLNIISSCGHAGRIDDGIHYFNYMTEEYGIRPGLEHYACVVDLFGRAGRLDKAFDTINSMPFPPDAGIWGTLLGACRVHGRVELAELALRNLLDLDPVNSGYYMLLSNIHADAGQWENVLKTRNLMKDKGVQKIPGYSWIEVNNCVNTFVSADRSHSQLVPIYSLLRSLLPQLKREGHFTPSLLLMPE